VTFEIALLLAIIAVALLLFSIERIPADIIALGVLLSLTLTRLVPPGRAFAGFGSDTVIMILGLLILTAGLVRTGVVELAARSILRRIGQKPRQLNIILLVAPALMSMFMSNTASTAFFLPIVIGLARRARAPISRVLMPLAFATILASSVTLVATSTNIVVSGLMQQAGLPAMGMFELTPVGLPIMVVGLAYMHFIGRKLIPSRGHSDNGSQDFNGDSYATETLILPGSPLVGKTLGQSGLGRDLDLTVLRVVRGQQQILAPQADLRLQESDVLLVEGQRDEILKIRNTAGIDIKAAVKLSDPTLQSEDIRIVEVIMLVGSPLIERTLKGIQFRERYGLQVLAINRQGETIHSKISQTRLRLGDILLIQGHRSNIAALQEDNTFRILYSLENKLPNLKRAPIAAAAFIGALGLAAFELLTFPEAMFLGVLVIFITRCITPEEAYRMVEWRALILIGSMLALGTALESTGAAHYLANQISTFVGATNPILLLSAFFALTVLLTQPMSNQAAAIVVVPIALQTAVHLNMNPRSFAMMIAVAASCSYLTPLEPACLMVYGPGGYKFMDFFKVGALLTVLIYIIAIVLVPFLWPV
jgi:di/tricarboxylate transporter